MTVIDNRLPLIRAGIDTYRQPVVFMRETCHVCHAEGFAALTRIKVTLGDRSVIATLNVLTDGGWLPEDTAALSEEAWAILRPAPGEVARFSHPEPPASVSAIRAKVYGETLGRDRFDAIIRDILDRSLSDLDLAGFVTACAGDRLSVAETLALTGAMQAAGETLDWAGAEIYDKHCVGGLPGNRTTPIVGEVARLAGRPYEVLRKRCTGDRSVEVSIPDSAALRQGTPVVLDDIAASGQTLVRALERLREAGCAPAVCMVIHAVFATDADAAIRAAGAARIVTTDTIPHPTNAIGTAALLAEALAPLIGGLDLPATGRPTSPGNTRKEPR